MKIKILGNAPLAATDRLRANPLNDNRESSFMFGKLLATISADGFAMPITVRSGNDKGKFPDGILEIINGEHRWKAAIQLKMPEVPIHDLGCISDLAAKKALLTLNKLRGEPDQDALSRLLREIHTDGGEDALESLPFDEDSMRDLLDGDALVAPTLEADSLGMEDDDDNGQTVDLSTKPSGRDLLVILEVQRLKQAELKPFLEVMRQWAAGRDNQDTPPWVELMILLKSKTTKRE